MTKRKPITTVKTLINKFGPNIIKEQLITKCFVTNAKFIECPINGDMSPFLMIWNEKVYKSYFWEKDFTPKDVEDFIKEIA